jgi:hypothetical protein
MAISINLKCLWKECVKTLDVWMVLQMWVNGLKSNGDSKMALELLFIHILNISCSTSKYQQTSKGGITKFDSLDHNIFCS